MTDKKRKGKRGEIIALNYLQKKGYIRVEQNYSRGRGEIDLIVRDKIHLIFVEVKFRTSKHFGFPESFVNIKKVKKILETADHYIIENNWNGPVRYDIVAILQIGDKIQISHFEDSFG